MWKNVKFGLNKTRNSNILTPLLQTLLLDKVDSHVFVDLQMLVLHNDLTLWLRMDLFQVPEYIEIYNNSKTESVKDVCLLRKFSLWNIEMISVLFQWTTTCLINPQFLKYAQYLTTLAGKNWLRSWAIRKTT